jgi:hypothetical protein
MSNVVILSDYRAPKQALPDPAELALMPYDDLVTWAGANFDRLVAAAKAKVYRPEWIGHQIAAHRPVTDSEAKAIADMVASAGPFLPTRLRWLARNLKCYKTGAELVAAAAKSFEYGHLVHIAAGLDRDIAKLRDTGAEIDEAMAAEIKALAADCRKTKNRSGSAAEQQRAAR